MHEITNEKRDMSLKERTGFMEGFRERTGKG